MTTQELFDILFYGVVLERDIEAVQPEQFEQEVQDALAGYRTLWNEPDLSTAGVMSAVICDFMQNLGENIKNPAALKNVYDEIG